MSRAEEIRLGLRQSGRGPAREKKFERSSGFWYEVAGLMDRVVSLGGLVSVYTSQDGAATCVSLKAGKDRKAYWLGPEDDYLEVIDRIEADWGLEWRANPLEGEIIRRAGELDS